MSLRERLIVREDPDGYDRDITALAASILRQTALIAGATCFSIIEIEFYYFGRVAHQDPFAHRDPIQAENPGLWYFHRSGNSYRGGSYKGLDLTFGGRGAYGGILLRTLRRDGDLISGPSLIVDRLLRETGHATVAKLADAVSAYDAFDEKSPLRLVEVPPRDTEILRTARVGLTLKRYDPLGPYRDMPVYLTRPDRFLTDPRAIRKGRTAIVLAMHQRGAPPEQIAHDTGSPRARIRALIDAYETATPGGSIEPYRGRTLSSHDLARVHRILGEH